MGADKKKISELKKKYERERDKKYEIIKNVSDALHWWEKTMDSTQELIDSFYQEGIRIINGKLSFREWLSISPFAPFRWVGNILHRAPFRVDKLHSEHRFKRDKVKVERILGGKDKYTPIQIARKLQFSDEYMEEVLRTIAEERGGKVEDNGEKHVAENAKDSQKD